MTLRYTITATGASAAQTLPGRERGPRTINVRASSSSWGSASVAIESATPDRPTAFQPIAGGEAITEDTQIPLTSVRGHAIRVNTTGTLGSAPIYVEIA